MAVGETAGTAAGPPRRAARVAVVAAPRPSRRRSTRPRWATKSRRRRPTVVKEADPELERLLAEEEEIERRTRQHHEAPKFHGGERGLTHVDAEKVKHRKQQRGRMSGVAKGGTKVTFGDYGIQALEPGLDHQPPDRGRSYRDDPLHQAWRQGLDHASSPTSRSPRSRPRPAWARARATPSTGSRS